MSQRHFFAELKRRNVYKVAVAYIVAGWALSQGIAQVFPVFDVPNWAIRLIVLLIIVGLPVALVLAWSFEITPDGIKRTETADAMPESARQKKHTWIYVVVIGGLVSIGLFLLGRYSAENKTASPSGISNKSIAVLPFDNLSRDPDNAFFAEGVQDEIRTRLSHIGDLKVISRTSTQKYKSAPDNLREIARQLGVTTVLEGSVQRSADKIRVSVELINAATDAHLWAEIYDRDLTDIFAVETEIAKTIAETLQTKLSGSETHAITARPTESSAAHQLYLKGRYFWNKTTGDDLKKAINYFNQAIAGDSNYAEAYVGLADAYLLLPFITGGYPQDCYPKAKAAAEKAVKIDDTLAAAHIAFAEVLRVYDFDYARSGSEFRRGLGLDPNSAVGHWRHSWLLGSLGRFDEAFAEIKRAQQLDPLSLIINTDLGYFYTVTGRFDAAIDQLRRTLEIDSAFYYAHGNLGEALEFQGSVDAAMAEYRKARELNDDPFLLAMLAHAHAIAGNAAEAHKFLNQLSEIAKRRYVQAYAFALVHLAMGDKKEALRWLDQSYRDHAGGDLGFIRVDPFLAPLRGDPQFEALAEKIVPASEFNASSK